MAERSDDKALQKLVATLRSVPTDDRTVAPRVLVEKFLTSPDAPTGDIVTAARAATGAARALDERSDTARLLTRRRASEALLLARTKGLVTQLEPWITQRRLLFFGQTNPPFRSLAAATHWIERESRTQPARSDEKFRDASIDADVDAFIERMLVADPWARSYGVASREMVLYFWKPTGDQGHVAISRNHPRALYGICRASETLADLTTLPQATVTAWLLAGIRPGQRVRLGRRRVAMPGLRLVQWRFRYPERSGTSDEPPVDVPPRLLLDLDVRDATDRNIRLARREAVQWFQRRYPAPRLTTKQQRVVEIVQQLGGPPDTKFDQSFWRRVARRLREQDPLAAARKFYRAQRIISLSIARQPRGPT